MKRKFLDIKFMLFCSISLNLLLIIFKSFLSFRIDFDTNLMSGLLSGMLNFIGILLSILYLNKQHLKNQKKDQKITIVKNLPLLYFVNKEPDIKKYTKRDEFCLNIYIGNKHYTPIESNKKKLVDPIVYLVNLGQFHAFDLNFTSNITFSNKTIAVRSSYSSQSDAQNLMITLLEKDHYVKVYLKIEVDSSIFSAIHDSILIICFNANCTSIIGDPYCFESTIQFKLYLEDGKTFWRVCKNIEQKNNEKVKMLFLE